MKTCKIEGCSGPVIGLELCRLHYRRFKKYEAALVKGLGGILLTSGDQIRDRFWAYVNKTSKCWEWTGYLDPSGYGRLSINNMPVLAHRLSWELNKGPITSAQHVLHRCDNPKCVRPSHLFLGDQVANNADKQKKGRLRYGTSHGEAHGCSKLTEDQVREILASTGPSEDVALRYCVSGRTVREIRTRKTWRHLAA